MKPKSIVVLSGGQDSATCLFKAQRESEVLGAVHFYYGQRHAVEFECAVQLAAIAKISLTRLEVPTLQQVGHSALTNSYEDIAAPHPSLAHLPASFVPGRNLIFLTFAAAYAMKVGATQIWTGVCQTDYSGYPDCRRDTIDALQTALRLGMDFPDLQIVAPLMNLSKAETFARADELGVLDVILSQTHTCYNGDRTRRHDWGYGCTRMEAGEIKECPACAVRRKGYLEFIQSHAKM